jgi:hypothetical protein
MNDEKLDKLFAAARGVKPDTARAEYGFETRLTARLRAEREQDMPWYAFAWKLVPTFAAVVVALGVWTFIDSNAGDLQSAITGDHDETTLAAFFTGGTQ